MNSLSPVDVAIIANEPTPYRLHVLRRLARELPQMKMHNIFTHTLTHPSMPWKVQVEPELNPVFFPQLALPRSRFNFTWRAYRLHQRISRYIREQGIRLIIQLGYHDLTRLCLLRWARRQGIPLLINSDSNVFGEGRVPWGVRLVKRRQVRWALKQAAGLMPMGVCGRAFWRVYLDHDKPSFLFPYEPDYQALMNRDETRELAFRQQHGLNPQRHHLLYCGRLVPHKGLDALLEAFIQVAQRRPEWDLVIAGGGPQEGALESRIPASLRDRVKFLGFLQFEDTRTCFHCCQVLIHPSLYEPWGLVINEAAACGLAIIATEVVGAAAELVRHGYNGLIVPPRSPQALAEAMLTVSEGNRWRQMQAASADMLKTWRSLADPVQGVREALHYFGLIPSDRT